jgi:hypothetical protein
VTINVEHLWLLIKDAWRADKWMDKLTIWFKPTGWRPEGFEVKYPVMKITDPYQYQKFSPPYSRGLLIWSLIQFFALFFFFIYVLGNISSLKIWSIYLFFLFVIVQVYSATELMNRNRKAPFYSMISTLVGFGIYFLDTTWFGTAQISTYLPSGFLLYFLVQSVMTLYFNTENQLSVLSNERYT